jgi:hypothetical protein
MQKSPSSSLLTSPVKQSRNARFEYSSLSKHLEHLKCFTSPNISSHVFHHFVCSPNTNYANPKNTSNAPFQVFITLITSKCTFIPPPHSHLPSYLKSRRSLSPTIRNLHPLFQHPIHIHNPPLILPLLPGRIILKLPGLIKGFKPEIIRPIRKRVTHPTLHKVIKLSNPGDRTDGAGRCFTTCFS